MKIKPLNRHLLVYKRPEEEKENSGFILPEDYKPTIEKYSVVKVLAVAEDSKLKDIKLGNEIVVETSMLFDVAESTLILENYVYGLIDEKVHI